MNPNRAARNHERRKAFFPSFRVDIRHGGRFVFVLVTMIFLLSFAYAETPPSDLPDSEFPTEDVEKKIPTHPKKGMEVEVNRNAYDGFNTGSYDSFLPDRLAKEPQISSKPSATAPSQRVGKSNFSSDFSDNVASETEIASNPHIMVAKAKKDFTSTIPKRVIGDTEPSNKPKINNTPKKKKPKKKKKKRKKKKEKNRKKARPEDKNTHDSSKIVTPQTNTDPAPEPEPEPEPEPISGVPHFEEDTFADVVAILRGGEVLCTGVVLSPHLVLTARHCICGESVVVARDASKPVFETRILDERAPLDLRIDAKLLRVDAPLPVTYRPYRLRGMNDPPVGDLRLLGFGATNTLGTKGQGIKRIGDLAVTGWGCSAYKSSDFGCTPESEMVIASTRLDTCDGDSGGPVMEIDWKSETWRLVAITSRPIANARRRCGDGGVYVRLDAIADWISEQIVSTEPPDILGENP